MSTDLLDGMADLKKRMEEIGNTVKGGIDAFRLSEETNSLSYFESELEEPQIVPGKLKPLRKGRFFKRPKNYKYEFKSFSEFMKLGFKDPAVFSEKHARAMNVWKAANSINTLDSESAGSLVLPEFAPEIASILYDNDILSRTNQFTISGNRMEFPKMQEASRADGARTGGILGYWIEEGDLASATRPQIQGTELKLKKLCVVVYLTQELIDDNSYALEQWVRQAVQRELTFMIGDSIFNGTGGGRPLGIFNSPVTVQVAVEAGQAAGTIVAQNILKMYARRRYGQPVNSYAWFINQDCEPQLNTMTLGSGGQNGVVYLPPGGLSVTPYATLMGLPVIPTEFNAALGLVGDICLGNLGNYLTINKGGVQELASQHVEFLREQVAIKFTFRVDGRPLYDRPTVPKNSTNAQSDFMVLAAR